MKIAVAILLALSFTQTGMAASKDKSQVIEIQVTEKGFEPSSIEVKPGTAVTLRVTRKTDATCATAIKIPSKKMKKDLPLNKPVNISLGKVNSGEIKFACGMDMLGGKILVQ